MILSQATLIAPDGTQIDLGFAPGVVGASSIDNSGNAFGYTIDSALITPAPLVVRRQHLPTFAGGIVASGRADVRDVTISGTVFGSSTDVVNELWQKLVYVCGDPLTNSIKLRFQPNSTMPLVQLEGVVEKLEPTSMSALEIQFTIAFVTGNPYASAVVPTPTGTINAPSYTLTSQGTVKVYPTITVATSGTVSSLDISIVHADQTSETLHLTGLPLTGPATVVVTTRPGYEDIQIVTGEATLRGLKYRVVGSAWPTVAPGANTVSVTASGGGFANFTQVEWTDGWLI